MSLNTDLEAFRFDPALRRGVEGRRVLITGSGKDGGIGQALAMAAALNGAAAVGVHYHRSYADGIATVEAINAAGGNAFPVQADVTNTSDVWASRSYVIRHLGGPPDLLICNSGLSEKGYLLGRAPREKEGESPSLRRARARKAFVENLADSTAVVNTKVDGFLYLTHLWVGEALHAGTELQIVYVSSRQAVDPGAGVPGYVLANFGVLSLPTVLRVNLGRHSDKVSAFSVALPFVRTGMTDAYAEDARVWSRWQPRMLEPHELAAAFLQLLGRPAAELSEQILQLDVEAAEAGTQLCWSSIALQPQRQELRWSREQPLVVGEEGVR